MWEYVKGSEADFEGAPDTITVRIGGGALALDYWAESFNPCSKFRVAKPGHYIDGELGIIHSKANVIAERRKVDNVNDASLQQAFDTVQRPAHYTQSDIECIDAIAAAVKGKSGIEAVCVANVIKYLWRYEIKDGVESVRKAQWYLDRLVKELSK